MSYSFWSSPFWDIPMLFPAKSSAQASAHLCPPPEPPALRLHLPHLTRLQRWQCPEDFAISGVVFIPYRLLPAPTAQPASKSSNRPQPPRHRKLRLSLGTQRARTHARKIQKECQNRCQVGCQKEWQIECQNICQIGCLIECQIECWVRTYVR